MKKNELKEKAETLIRQIRNFENEYDNMLKLGKLNQEKINTIRIDHLKKLKQSLETGYLKSIDKLPEEEPALPDESLDMADSNHIIAIRTQFTNIHNKLSSIERDINSKQRIANPDPKTLQASYDQLISELDSEKFSITFPEFYLEDNQLQTLVDQVKSHNVHTPHSSVGRMYRDIKTKPQSEALPVLNLIHEQYKNFKKKAQERFEKLVIAEQNYHKVLQEKEKILTKANELQQHARINLAKEALKFVDPMDTSLSLLVKQINDRMADMTNKDYLAVVGFTGNRFNQLVHAKNLCKDDADLLQMGINSLETKLERIENTAEELQSTIEKQIKLKTNEFLRGHSVITTALNSEYLDTKSLDKIKHNLDEALSSSQTIHPIQIARDTLAKVVKLLAQLNEEIPKHQKKLDKKEKKTIKQIISLIKKESEKIVTEVKSGKFNLIDSELALVNTIKNHLKSEEEILSSNSTKPLKVTDYQEIQRSLASAITALRKVLLVHEQAKDIIEKNNNFVFAEAINNSSYGPQLLATVGQYVNEGYLQKIESLLPEFNPAGLNAVNSYMSSQRGELANQIKNKLAFINLLSAKAIDYRPFLNKPRVLAATMILAELSLTEVISQRTLMSESFIAAIAVLNDLNLLTKENVQELTKSPEKCDVICQQAVLHNESAINKLSHEAYSVLIDDFLKTENNVAKAVNEIQKNIPIHCQHWALILVKESPALIEILNHESQTESNLQFLQPMFLDAKTLNSHIEDYLCNENTPEKMALKKLARERFKACINKHKTTLDALITRDNFSSPESFEKIAKVFDQIFDFSANYPANDKKTKNELMRFTNDVIPLLLNTSTPEKKKNDIVSLANERFQREDFPLLVLADVLQCITGAFLILMPIRYYALNKNPFFSKEKTGENELINSITEELINNKNADEEGENQEPVIK